MAKNDVILLDSIIEERLTEKFPSEKKDEVFEYLAIEQILKEYDLSQEDIEQGIVDGRNDGGIDGVYIFVNGHLITEIEACNLPKSNCDLQIYILSCKHHDTFKQELLNSQIATITEIFDFSLDDGGFKVDYNEKLLEKRNVFLEIYKKCASKVSNMEINFIYASRGNSSIVGENIISRSKQLKKLCTDFFSVCNSNYTFYGAKELLTLYRKRKNYKITLPFVESISQSNQKYVLLCSLDSYFKFLCDEEGKLKRYLFDANVRDYMNLNRVNSEITNTLATKDNCDFWWLNNGITILASAAHNIGKSLQIDNVQIVNGLQTSQSIYNFFSRNSIDQEDRTLLVKVITVESLDLQNKIIWATNSQTNIDLYSLHAGDDIQKDIENVLLKEKIYYERRVNYYLNQGIESAKIVAPLYVAAAYTNLVMKQPRVALIFKQKFLENKLN